MSQISLATIPEAYNININQHLLWLQKIEADTCCEIQGCEIQWSTAPLHQKLLGLLLNLRTITNSFMYLMTKLGFLGEKKSQACNCGSIYKTFGNVTRDSLSLSQINMPHFYPQ